MQILILLPSIYDNFCWSDIDSHCPAISQNWQLVQEGHAYKQCIIFTLKFYSI